LKAITTDKPTFNEENVAALILESIKSPLYTEAAKHRFEIGEHLATELKAFYTRDPGRIAVDYKVAHRYMVSSVMQDDSIERRAITHGSCYYDLATNSLDGAYVEQIVFAYRGKGGHGYTGRTFENEDPFKPFHLPPEPFDLVCFNDEKGEG
jgi:hypothetical protein